jgi:hypothetical protein
MLWFVVLLWYIQSSLHINSHEVGVSLGILDKCSESENISVLVLVLVFFCYYPLKGWIRGKILVPLHLKGFSSNFITCFTKCLGLEVIMTGPVHVDQLRFIHSMGASIFHTTMLKFLILCWNLILSNVLKTFILLFLSHKLQLLI